MKDDWDEYFRTEIKPLSQNWGFDDLIQYRRWYFMWLEFINTKLPIFRHINALEIGSGIGAIVSLLAERGVTITGSDVSKKMIKIAKSMIPLGDFVYCNIEKNVPKKNFYNLIFAFEVLEHLKNYQQAIKNIYKGLKNGGFFIGTSPYPYKKNLLDPTHYSVRFPDEWKKEFINQGFQGVSVSPMSFLPYLWRISKYLNIPIPLYIQNSKCISTILIIAKKS